MTQSCGESSDGQRGWSEIKHFGTPRGHSSSSPPWRMLLPRMSGVGDNRGNHTSTGAASTRKMSAAQPEHLPQPEHP
jgi:hypothetical protein